MMTITPGDDSNEGCAVTSAGSALTHESNLNGVFGLLCYLENNPGYDTGGGSVSIAVALDTVGSGITSNYLDVNFNPNLVKEGWNFLVFKMRDFNAYVVGNNVTEYHPYGTYPVAQGSGAAANIIADPIVALRIIINGAGVVAAGTKLYLDSMWTGFETLPQVIIGFDAANQGHVDHALPKFQQYGWVGYCTENANYWDGAEDRVWTDYSGSSYYANQLYGAGWEVVNHGLQHLPGDAVSPKMGDLTLPGEITYEVWTMHAIMRQHGWIRGSEFYISPRSSTSRLTEKVIKNLGFKFQRHANNHNHLTPWGFPNPGQMAGYAIGKASTAAYNYTLNNAVTAVTGLHTTEKLTNFIAMLKAYGGVYNLYTHEIEESGALGSAPSSSTAIILATFNWLMEALAAEDDAGTLRVRDGFTGLWYGIGR